jgi:hypothetical protein
LAVFGIVVVAVCVAVVVTYVRIVVVHGPSVVVVAMVAITVVHHVMAWQPAGIYPTITSAVVFPITGNPISVSIRG